MATNIEMNIMQDTGQYEVVYPQTIVENIVDIQDTLDNYYTKQDIQDNYYTIQDIQDNYYTKNEVLLNTTKALYNLDSDAVPNDVLVRLALGIGKYGYFFKLVDENNNPMVGYTIEGLLTQVGGACVTNENGEALGVSESNSISIQVKSKFSDYQDIEKTIQATDIITVVNLIMEDAYEENQIVTLSTSKNLIFSDRVAEADFCVIGGGGGGSAGTGSPKGGGGGYLSNLMVHKIIPDIEYVFVVGSGGYGGQVNSNGADGGTSSVSENGHTIVEALGGKGSSTGKGNGSTGTSMRFPDGTDGSGHVFNDPALGSCGGGGGWGHYPYSAESRQGIGGSPYGGNGGAYLGDNGKNGRGPGGGGGGGSPSGSGTTGSGGSGGNGVIYMRVRYKK